MIIRFGAFPAMVYAFFISKAQSFVVRVSDIYEAKRKRESASIISQNHILRFPALIQDLSAIHVSPTTGLNSFAFRIASLAKRTTQ